MRSNPLSAHLVRPERLTLPSGASVQVSKCFYTFQEWLGDRALESYGRKTVLDIGGLPVFAEVAILRWVAEAKWEGVWVDTFSRKFRKGLSPVDSFALPKPARRSYERITKANRGRCQGCWDVLAWKDRNFLFIESKRKGKDSLRRTQLQWLESALAAGVPLESFVIFEWDVLSNTRHGASKLLDQAFAADSRILGAESRGS